MQCRLDGQIALVTGASSGIGLGVAKALAQAGAAVAVNYHSQKEPADRLVDEIATAGGKAIAVRADVSDEDAVSSMFATVVEKLGALDILVANSGLQQDSSFAEMSLSQWRKVIDVNLTGQFLCARAAIRQFDAQGARDVSAARGKIIHMSSVHDIIPWAGHVNYAASKGGILMLMKSLAQEVAARGIRVNAISPGAIRTAINKEETEGEKGEKLLDLIPYRRIGHTDDIARVATFLASDMADYIIGTTIYVDGGMTLYPEFNGNG